MTLESLIAKIKPLKERNQRAFSLRETLLTIPLESLKIILEEMVDFSLRDNDKCKELLFSFTDLLEESFPVENDENQRRLHAALSKIETSNRTLLFFLSPPPPHRFPKRGENQTTDILIDYLPLGVKRSLSKTMDKNLIKRILLDKDPIVIKHLLNNPLITEKEVLKITSSRPNTSSVIKIVFLSEKWIKNYKVKEAIIKNPYSPFRIALLLLMFMNRKELLEVANDEGLHPELRIEAKRILKLRGEIYK